MTAKRHRSRKDVAVASTLAIAVSLVAGGVIANAQSFNVSGYSVPAGSATSYAGSGTTTIQVYTNNAVIDWTPTDTAIGGGAINFQSAGTTATFYGNPGFTVLNRIVPVDPTRAIQFNGNVSSLYYLASGGTATGGTVFFYSPGGIILGSTATFDVGNLGLTTSDLTYDPTTADFGGANGTAVFQAATQTGSQIAINAGATINALNAGSYVAMVAPSINQAGTINVNGSAALVAAEGATINFSPDGLFDIQVDVGSDAGANALVNTGTITGTAGTAGVEYHRIYMVAVPKNTAIGMVIGSGSQLGFDVAASADTVGNTVVLSAGNDIYAGSLGNGSVAGSGAASSISISDSGGTVGFTSAVNARATTIDLTASGTTSFASAFSAIGNNAIDVRADGGSLTVNGNLDLSTDSYVSDPTQATDGGSISLQALNGGAVTVNGDATLSATALIEKNFDGIMTGGSVIVGASGAGSTATFNGNLTLDASALDTEPVSEATKGGSASLFATNGGSVTAQALTSISANAQGTSGADATGGLAEAYALNGGSLALGNLSMNADAAANYLQTYDADGGTATGGIVRLSASGTQPSTVSANTVAMSANADGGATLCYSCTVPLNGGSATGGTVTISASGAGNSLALGATALTANARGGDTDGANAGFGQGGTSALSVDTGGAFSSDFLSMKAGGTGGGVGTGGLNPGDGYGGSATVTNSGGTIDLTNGFELYAVGVAQDTFLGGNGGNGIGGVAQFVMTGGVTTIDCSANFCLLNADASGSSGLNGGNATAGTTAVTVDGAGTVFNATDINGYSGFYMSAHAAGGGSMGNGVSGTATGGDMRFVATNGGAINLNAYLSMDGTGYASQDLVYGSDGGDGIGGSALFSQDSGGSITQVGGVLINLGALAGTNSGGGDLVAGAGTGGTLTIQSLGLGGISFSGPGFSVSADGIGGQGVNALANGGVGTGGRISITATNGGAVSIDAGVNISIGANGHGGTATQGGLSGTGLGGTIRIGTVAGTSAALLSLTALSDGTALSATGYGGDGDSVSFAGMGMGGLIQLFTDGGGVTADGPLNATANGYGGSSSNSAAAGGLGQGGTIEALATNGFTLAFGGDLSLTANGLGGYHSNDGDGGAGMGGTVHVFSSDGSTLTAAATVSAYAQGQGGDIFGFNGNGGAGTGGEARFEARSGSIDVTSNITLDVSGFGGSGYYGGAGTGGTGTGGSAYLGTDGDVAPLVGPGAFTAGGAIALVANGTGGYNSIGGDGIGGLAMLYARNGTFDGQGATLSADGVGGYSTPGGAGGTGTGGSAAIQALSSVNGASGLTLTSAQVSASGTGGAGSYGLNSGDNGGNGGDAIGGSVTVTGSAGNGVLSIGALTANANAYGGAGGDGAANSGIGGSGGFGGTAISGSVLVGTQSGIATTDNTGSASFGTVNAFANAVGGAGGAGGFGTTNGNGGAGGNAFATTGGVTLQASGSLVSISGATVLTADAQGGNGGNGGANGAGGNATTGGGGVFIVATSRDLVPAQQGTLVAGDIAGTSHAIAGSGGVAGLSTQLTSAIGISVLNSTLNANSITLAANASTIGSSAAPSAITVTNGSAAIADYLTFDSAGPVALALDTGDLTVTNLLTIYGLDWVLPGAAPANAGTAHVGAVDFATSNDLASYANLDIAGNTALTAPGSILFGNVTDGGTFSAQALGGGVTLGNVTGTDVTAQAAFDVLLGDISATGFFNVIAGMNLVSGQVTAGRYVDLASGGTVTVSGNIDAGANVRVFADGDIALAGVTAGIVNPSTTTGDTYSIDVYSLGSVAAGPLSALQDLGVTAAQSIAVGAVSGADMQFLGSTGTTLGPITATGRVLIADVSMRSLGTTAGGYDKEPAFAATPIAMSGPITISGAAVTGGFFHAATQSSFTSDSITAGGDILLTAGGNILSGVLSSGGAIAVDGAQVNTGNVTSSGGAITLVSSQLLGTGAVSGSGNVRLQSGRSIASGAVTSSGGSVTLTAAEDIATGAIAAATSVSATTPFTFTSGDITAPGGVTVSAGTGLGTGAIDSGTQATSLTTASNDLIAGDISAGSLAASAPGALTLGAVQVANSANILAGGAATIQSLTGGGAIAVTGGSIGLGDVSSTGGTVNILSAGLLSLGNVSASDDVALQSTANAISAGAITSSGGAVTLTAAQALTVGNVSAGGNLTASSGTTVQTGALSAGLALSIDAGQSLATGGLSAGGAAALTAGTNISVGGPSSVASFTAQASGDVSAMQIDAANAISVYSGGLATIGGVWSAPQITVTSNDIAISLGGGASGPAGGLNAGVAGTIRLTSLNSAGMFIGDGLTPGAGYALSNAEWALINSGSVFIVAPDNAALGTDITIGDLTITGPLSGSTIDDPNGVVSFATLGSATGLASGTIRITGNVVATGFQATNALVFNTGAFELDAATGSVKVDDGLGSLSGIIQVTADFIHIAEGSILDKLRTDPFYAERFAELNAPAAVQRPDGVFNALGLDLYPGQTFYVQNTGTAALPAGFVTSADNSDVTLPVGASAAGSSGLISVIVNGAFVTPNGLVTGIDAYNQLVNAPDADFSGITTDSTFNGCVIADKSCVSQTQEDPAPSISDEFGLLAADKLSEEPFGQQEGESAEERQNDENADAATSRGPIAPPAPLIDTRPMRPPVLVTEPQTGSGNPSLQGTGGGNPGQGGDE